MRERLALLDTSRHAISALLPNGDPAVVRDLTDDVHAQMCMALWDVGISSDLITGDMALRHAAEYLSPSDRTVFYVAGGEFYPSLVDPDTGLPRDENVFPVSISRVRIGGNEADRTVTLLRQGGFGVEKMVADRAQQIHGKVVVTDENVLSGGTIKALEKRLAEQGVNVSAVVVGHDATKSHIIGESVPIFAPITSETHGTSQESHDLVPLSNEAGLVVPEGMHAKRDALRAFYEDIKRQTRWNPVIARDIANRHNIIIDNETAYMVHGDTVRRADFGQFLKELFVGTQCGYRPPLLMAGLNMRQKDRVREPYLWPAPLQPEGVFAQMTSDEHERFSRKMLGVSADLMAQTARISGRIPKAVEFGYLLYAGTQKKLGKTVDPQEPARPLVAKLAGRNVAWPGDVVVVSAPAGGWPVLL